ncbi:MAG TPA: SPOR domain-containing protein [Thermoanaerobaculia bacterium]|nr:SPOR domain-containing protein [Thermoanaerobaculia bacterium]
MTEPHEPSYYEIALTNRQVVVAFVILLACLLAAFFSGVWIGRGGIDLHREQVVRATPPPAPSPEGRTLEELKFFADRPGHKKSDKSAEPAKPEEKAEEKSAAAAPSAAGGTTLQQDLKASRSAAPQPSMVRATPPAEEVAARPEPVEAQPARPAVTAPAASSKSATRGKSAAPTPPAAAPEEETADATAGAGKVVIQVFASADQAEAKRVRERLSKGGQSSFLSPLTVDGRTMYRVRIGPFTTRQAAQKVAEKVRKTYKLDTWLTE